MAVAASKVKAVCTDSEVALVRASRKPELEQLSAAELKRNAARARKLFDKWQGQERAQARQQVRQAGTPDTETNTSLKAQIFREALDSFEARRTKLGATGKPAAKNKKARVAEHRARRSAVRSGMAAALDLVNRERQPSKPAKAKGKAGAVKPAKPAKAAAKPTKVAAAGKAVAAVKKPTPTAKPAKALSKPLAKPGKSKAPAFAVSQLAPMEVPNAAKQLRASTKAKQVRIAKSGKATRVVGHISARGRKAQARRDSK